MKAKNLAIFAVLTLFTAVMIFSGCGKSDKMVKVTSGEKVSDNKGNKTVKIDTTTSTINWTGRKVTGEHKGTIKISKGEVNLDGEKIVGGKFDIDMKTIVDVDLTDPEWNTKLITHLKSADFFDIEKFPASKFEITSVAPFKDEKKPGLNFTVNGNLTMKDVTKGISFPGKINVSNGVVTAEAEFDVDRTDWGIKYGSGKFFDNLGDKMINDTFTLSFKINAK